MAKKRRRRVIKKDDGVTPLMKQYNAIKAKYDGALLLFRVGDFYETFGEDAITASKILDIVLTKRANGAASEIELAGFPHHALETYLPRLVRAGVRVAICDQLEDPKEAKGIVKRGVTELVTPGLAMNDNVLERKKNNYLASVCTFKKGKNEVFGLSFLDLSTGEFSATEGSRAYVEKLVQSFKPAELIFPKKDKPFVEERLYEFPNRFPIEDWIFSEDYAHEKLTRHFQVKNLKGFGLEGQTAALFSAGAVLYYLEATEHHELAHLQHLARLDDGAHVWMDRFTIRNLEILYPQQDSGVPLVDVLDRTLTPMGARMLRRWLALPLRDLAEIQRRHAVVARLVEAPAVRQEVGDQLEPITDLERLASKIATGRIAPREFTRLLQALRALPALKSILAKQTETPALQQMGEFLNPLSELEERIASTLVDDPPALLSAAGPFIREGVHEELDEYRKIATSGKDFLDSLLQREINRTGISTLKINFNKVFGYYLEVRNTHKDKVPEDWIRKQTLVSAERYITQELKEYEEKIIGAEGKIQEIEHRLYRQLVQEAGSFVTGLQANARTLAALDVLYSFAEIADAQAYCQPHMSEGRSLQIEKGRHPVIETQLPPGESYIPNDVTISQDEQQILIITGPNMAGKSALLRQTALISLMAQVGSFVPAKAAKLGVVDKIFTRVGASDNLAQGESTFMVEMTETASILNNLGNNSLILMDEIGRGTSTYDGISIAWAIVEYLHKQPEGRRPLTLFATHYHELNQLAEEMGRVKNFNVAVKEVGKKIVFLRKLREGGSAHSFGINVAQIAGMPQIVVQRAETILHLLEAERGTEKDEETLRDVQEKLNAPRPEENPELVRVHEALLGLEVNSMTPVEALLKLHELKKWLS